MDNIYDIYNSPPCHQTSVLVFIHVPSSMNDRDALTQHTPHTHTYTYAHSAAFINWNHLRPDSAHKKSITIIISVSCNPPGNVFSKVIIWYLCARYIRAWSVEYMIHAWHTVFIGWELDTPYDAPPLNSISHNRRVSEAENQKQKENPQRKQNCLL